MQRSLEVEELEPEEERHDPEFTLGPVTLLAILCGLLLLCGLFFAWGYRAGRRSSPTAGLTITRSAEGQTLTAVAGSSLSKPPAKGLVPAAQPSQAVAQTSHAASFDGTPAGSALTTYAPAASISDSSHPQVRAALPSVSNGSQTTVTPTTSYQVQPALAPGSGVMVQVAAVSHIEDANVLMNALRKRGYAVVARRQPADDLVHVQIGPFANRGDADAMSHKLLSDGYNAVVMP
jgi:DedD protein